MISANFQQSGLGELVQDLVNAEATVGVAVAAVIAKGALSVKKDAVARFEAQRVGAYLPHYSRAISYEIATTGHVTVAVIGPESDLPQGGMGLAIEEGTARHAPMPHLYPALDAQEAPTEAFIAKVAAEAIGG